LKELRYKFHYSLPNRKRPENTHETASLGVVGALNGEVIGASAATGKNFFSVVSTPRVARSLHGPSGIGAVA
jgi:hypothetical protein